MIAILLSTSPRPTNGNFVESNADDDDDPYDIIKASAASVEASPLQKVAETSFSTQVETKIRAKAPPTRDKRS
jgi:hypothetical protein